MDWKVKHAATHAIKYQTHRYAYSTTCMGLHNSKGQCIGDIHWYINFEVNYNNLKIYLLNKYMWSEDQLKTIS